MIDANTDLVTSTLSNGEYPVGVSLTPDGNELYVAENANSTQPGYCQVFSTATGDVVTRFRSATRRSRSASSSAKLKTSLA